ncbi:MAG TPA: helix-turn-helix transcriptional regulator [Thermomicrobiales bacterium]
MSIKKEVDIVADGKASYEEWRAELLGDPESVALYEEEARKKDLWLQLVEARHAAGLSRAEMAERLGVSEAQVTRIERRGYDACTIRALQRYVEALGPGYSLTIEIARRSDDGPAAGLNAAS